ncbi:MAG: RnfABCDGE type electron transport complex subunit D [Pygmaiobacter sp.]|nr:RnfABCDGE type electron transport complex subunit D [Pygmaiobacter sp.]
MDERLIVTASPHIRDNTTTRGLMGNVLIALVPCVVASALLFGYRALLVVGVTTAACVGLEYLYTMLLHKKNPVGDLSACVTGVILGLNFPAGMPLWICVVGAFVAIVITKQLFGGLGFNFANPALVGRLVLFLSFTSRMTAYVFPDMAVDALATATPLAPGVDKASINLLDMLLGVHGGVLGETCAAAILIGLAFLLATHTIGFAIPGSIVGTVFVLSLVATRDLHTALISILSGGLLFGAVFMATDYVTSPFTTIGKVFYGIFIGLITFTIRQFGSMNEGMSYAILLGNLLTPWFNTWSHQIPLGYVKAGKKGKKAKEKPMDKQPAPAAGKGGAV